MQSPKFPQRPVSFTRDAFRLSVVTAASLLLVLLAACSPNTPEENTPAIRQQLNDVQVDLNAANRAAEDRLREVCGEQNTDC